MITFKTISYRNLLSVGDQPVEIDFRKNKTNLIIGANGEGKSTLLDAISFVLFGRPHRNVNKPQLVNSINGGKLFVEIDFEIGSDKYQVKRGIHPNIFEIWKNGNLQVENSKIEIIAWDSSYTIVKFSEKKMSDKFKEYFEYWKNAENKYVND